MLSKIDKELSNKFITCAKYVKKSHGQYMTQTKILEIIHDADEIISQKALQEKLGIQSGSMSEVVIKLEKKGYIERIKSSQDRRAYDIILTEEGQEEYHKHKEKEHDSSTLFVDLNKEEKKELNEMLGRLIDGWLSKDPDFLENTRTHHGHKK